MIGIVIALGAVAVRDVGAFGEPGASAEAAHDHSSHDHGDGDAHESGDGDDEAPPAAHAHDDLQGFEQYTEPGGVWPPRQAGLENDRREPTRRVARAKARVGRYNGGAATRTQRGLARVLGARFERIDSGPAINAKGRVLPGVVRTVYFSYSNSETVELLERAGRIVRITRTPSTERQPPRTENEQRRAVAIARRLVRARYGSRVDELTGYAILGLPDATNPMPDPGTAHFSDRILYVSFHIDALSDPEYMVWVDLTNNRVVRAEEA